MDHDFDIGAAIDTGRLSQVRQEALPTNKYYGLIGICPYAKYKESQQELGLWLLRLPLLHETMVVDLSTVEQPQFCKLC
jgi:hypothetical protein